MVTSLLLTQMTEFLKKNQVFSMFIYCRCSDVQHAFASYAPAQHKVCADVPNKVCPAHISGSLYFRVCVLRVMCFHNSDPLVFDSTAFAAAVTLCFVYLCFQFT